MQLATAQKMTRYSLLMIDQLRLAVVELAADAAGRLILADPKHGTVMFIGSDELRDPLAAPAPAPKPRGKGAQLHIAGPRRQKAVEYGITR